MALAVENHRDLASVPNLSFSAVESFAKSRNKASGDKHISKGVKYFSEKYIENIRVIPADDGCAITATCYKSYKRNEKPYKLRVDFIKTPFAIQHASCECPIGLSEGCGHVVGLLFQLANLKMMGCRYVPEDVAKTSQPCTWRAPRGQKISGKNATDVEVYSYKPRSEDDDPPKPITSTLYNPLRTPLRSPLELLAPLQAALPTSLMTDFLTEDVQNTEQVQTKFGRFCRGSPISYQQKVSAEFVINNFADTNFPSLPVMNCMVNQFETCHTQEQLGKMQELVLTSKEIEDFEVKTRVQSSSKLWHALRRGRITASNVGAIFKRKKEDVSKFLPQLKSTKTVQTAAMKQGLASEPVAAEKYSKLCGETVNVYPCGIVISPVSPWLAASPDRKVYNSARPSQYGLLEIKCPASETVEAVDCLKKDAGGYLYLNRSHSYYYQVMTQLAVTGLPWCDFFVWCGKDETHHLETILFNPEEWQDIKDKLDIFFFTHYLI